MPKKQLTDSPTLGDAAPSNGLAGWQATGLALAAASLAARTGVGALVGAVIFAPVVYALVRLRRHAPDARSTAGLVGSTLGRRGKIFAAILQVTGYALVALTAAQSFGQLWVPPEFSDELFAPVHYNPWLWSLWAAAAIVVAAVMAFALPDRIIAGIAAFLALGGLLIQFYYGLAVIARALSGTVTEQFVAPDPPTPMAIAGTLAILAVVLVGFEVVTTRTHRSSASGWSMGLAIGVVVIVAMVVWWASQYSGYGVGRLNSTMFGFVVADMYGGTGAFVVHSGAAMFVFAGLLALLWGISAVTSQLDATVPSDAVFGGVVTAMIVVAVALIQFDWTFDYVAGLVLVGLYAVVLVANARIAADSVVTWWLRLVMPIVLAALVLLPLLWAEFSLSALTPVAIAALLIAAAGVAAVAGTRSRPD